MVIPCSFPRCNFATKIHRTTRKSFRHDSLTWMSKCKAILAALLAAAVSTGRAVTHHPGPYVPLCTHITLTASYLADAEPGKGPGFLFVINNDTNKEIRLAMPVPS